MKDILFLDFFGVMAKEVAPRWFSKYFAPNDAKRIKADIFERADLGLISEAETYIEMERVSGIPKEEIKREFYSMIEPNAEMVGLALELKKRVPVYLLSNAAKPFLRNILKKWDLYKCFDEVFISSEMRLAKPSPEYFREVLRKTGVKPKGAIFVDDNPKNIKGAGNVGISGILYRDFPTFKKELSKYLDLSDITI